jgi:hypothetical protein
MLSLCYSTNESALVKVKTQISLIQSVYRIAAHEKHSSALLCTFEEGIQNIAGRDVVISYDRWFLDRICPHILGFEGDSQVYYFEGDFNEYEENKQKRLGDTTPQRIKYKKLVRV